MRINDPRFLKRFMVEFCRRGIYGRDDREALKRLRIEVVRDGEFGLLFSVYDREGSIADIVWSSVTAYPRHYTLTNMLLRDCDRLTLHKALKAFFKRHHITTERVA